MKMHINPVYRKELKVSVRSFRFALLITAYNLILALIALFIFFIEFDSSINRYVEYQSVLYIYLAVALLECGLVFFIVPILTASSIAGERERQTLEILLTTTMKPMQIVVGKLLSSISTILLLVLSSVPVVSIVFSIGGVPVFAVAGLVVMILAVAIYIGSVGIWCSARLKKVIPSAVTAFAILFIIVVGGVAVLWGVYFGRMAWYEVNRPMANVPGLGNGGLILLLNPLFTAIDFFSKTMGQEGFLDEFLQDAFSCQISKVFLDHWFWISIASQLLVAFLLLLLASKQLDPLRKRRMKRKERKELRELKKLEKARQQA